jgi:hypothetical protein
VALIPTRLLGSTSIATGRVEGLSMPSTSRTMSNSISGAVRVSAAPRDDEKRAIPQ